MPTERLHLTDSLLLSFDARVVAVETYQGKPAVVLDRTAFYAEGGGQLGDHGKIHIGDDELDVLDVQIDEGGVVHHLLAKAAPESAKDAAAHGEIARERRRDFMSQHTGQHMLSAALLEIAGAETISSRLGAKTSTIDTPLASIDEARLAEAEILVNDWVLDDRPVRILFPSPEEIPSLGLRRTPKVTENIRVIEVEGVDRSPCGGTHCRRTGEVGPVRITGTERYKGGTRITFLAGKRAIDDARAKDAALRELARSFSCGPLDVPNAVAKLRAELRDRMDKYGVARGELITLVAARILDDKPADPSGTTIVVARRDDDDVGALRALAGALAKRPDVVAFVVGREGGGGDRPIVIERGAKATFDAGKWLKDATAAHGGRGGGREERAEGRIAAAVDVERLARGG